MLQDLPITAYLVASSIYSVYLHPVSEFLGPKVAAFSGIPYLRAQLSGKLPHSIKELHDQYSSNDVRISPYDLSFIEPSAWDDMLMFHRGRENFQKDVIVYGNLPQGVHAVLTQVDSGQSPVFYPAVPYLGASESVCPHPHPPPLPLLPPSPLSMSTSLRVPYYC